MRLMVIHFLGLLGIPGFSLGLKTKHSLAFLKLPFLYRCINSMNTPFVEEYFIITRWALLFLNYIHLLKGNQLFLISYPLGLSCQLCAPPQFNIGEYIVTLNELQDSWMLTFYKKKMPFQFVSWNHKHKKDLVLSVKKK